MATGSLKKTSGELTTILTFTHEKNGVVESGSTENFGVQPCDGVATKKLLRKIDLHLIPILALIYLLCFLDRTNIGNARLDHMEEDLGMRGFDYNIALSVFFPFYALAEIPSNIMLKKVRPSVWLTTIAVIWSIITICTGLVHNLQGLIACRIFLGITEAGVFPGVLYYITMWYPRHECGFRMALFTSTAIAAGAFGGLLARGITNMSGVGGKSGWSWIFILEGLLTLCVGSISYWLIQDYPETARFLSKDERTKLQKILADDSGSLSNDFNIKYVYQAFRDWKIWVNMFIAIGIVTPVYSIALFLPTIIKNLGYTNNQAQLMTVPPYMVACFCTVGASYIADKSRQKGTFILAFQIVAIIGFAMLISSTAPHTQYAGTFLAAIGIFPLGPFLGAWTGVNVGGSLKRGVAIAMWVGFGNFGGIIAAFVYLPKNAPRFVQGHAILLGLISMSFILTACMSTYFRRENARRDKVMAERGLTLEMYTEEMKYAEREKGDDASYWRYAI